ncbi:MAG TPA: ribonuclease E inhibitor RraB [Terricaulis sp.]|nr:ribonuclease E inhibitor RraB [Terricaulis sp.]
MSWPDDSDGDVLRRMHAAGFDFARPVWIDFNVEFIGSSQLHLALKAIGESMPEATSAIEGDEILVRLQSRLTYPFVVAMQQRLSAVARPYGGVCDTWGVLMPPASS